MATNWYYSKGDQQFGPISAAELKQLAATGQLSRNDHVWKDGMDNTVPASKVKGLFSPQQPESPPTRTPAEQPAHLPPVTAPDAPAIPSSETTKTASRSSTIAGDDQSSSESLASDQQEAISGKCALCRRQDKGREITYCVGTTTGDTYFHLVTREMFEFHDSQPMFACNRCMWQWQTYWTNELGCFITCAASFTGIWAIGYVYYNHDPPSVAVVIALLALFAALFLWRRFLKWLRRVPDDAHERISDSALTCTESELAQKWRPGDGAVSSSFDSLFGSFSGLKTLPDKIRVSHAQANKISKRQAVLLEKSRVLEAEARQNPQSVPNRGTALYEYLVRKGVIKDEIKETTELVLEFARNIDKNGGTANDATSGWMIADYVSDDEKQIAKEAQEGKSLGAEADGLVEELITIGRSDGFLSKPDGEKFNESHHHIRACEIGKFLNDKGGKDLMIAVAYRVEFALGHGRTLESCWDGIGEWLA